MAERELTLEKCMVYAHAMGSAFGLLGKSKGTQHKESLVFPYNFVILDYEPKSWTIATDLMLITYIHPQDEIPEAITKLRKKGLDPQKERVYNNIGRILKSIVIHPNYLTNAESVAAEIWSRNGCRYAPALCLSMCLSSILWDMELDVLFITRVMETCQLLSPDPRCIVSCWHVCISLKTLIYKGYVPPIEKVIDLISDMSRRYIHNFTQSDCSSTDIDLWMHDSYMKEGQYNYMKEYKDICDMALKAKDFGTLAGIINMSNNSGYVYKALAMAIFALKMPLHDTEEKAKAHITNTIISVTAIGGNTDVIVSIISTIMAVRYYQCNFNDFLPSWINHMNRKLLDDLTSINI